MPTDDPPWTDALAAADLPRDDVIGVAVAGRALALYTVGEAVYATDDRCTHGDGRLCEGFLDGHTIECPLHQGTFDVRTGQPTCDVVTEPVRCYPVKLEGGRVWLQVG